MDVTSRPLYCSLRLQSFSPCRDVCERPRWVPRHLPRRLREVALGSAAFAETFAQVAQASNAQLLCFTTTLQIQKPNTLRVIQKMSTSRKYARMANGLWMEGRREAPGRMML